MSRFLTIPTFKVGGLRNLRGLTLAIGAVFATYFSVAPFMKNGYVRPVEPHWTVLDLGQPLRHFTLIDGFAYYAVAPSLDGDADTDENIERSPYVVYEGDRPLGPAHAEQDAIAKFGHGRFSHWQGIGFIFSSSDGTNPMSNGRKYRVVLPISHKPSDKMAPAGAVAELKHPFRKSPDGGYGYLAPAPALDKQADSSNDFRHSPYVVYEDGLPLGPAHTIHTEISKLGRGRFSHWKDMGFIFSSSDGTNPVSNGRKYWVVLPP